MDRIEPIPAFNDNYIWALVGDDHAWLVDPGEARPARAYLDRHGLRLAGVLVTHWHPDHIGGIAELVAASGLPVIGPADEAMRIPVLTRAVVDGEEVEVLGRRWRVIAVPGHTLGHIAYYSEGHLLCGDTLFSGGCGRLFEGRPEQMHASLSRLAALPDDTLIYCAHEYTTANLAFARAVEPGNTAVSDAIDEVAAWRRQGRPSLPSTLARERRINPFLRTGEPAVVMAARQRDADAGEPAAVFATLRRWKDEFKPPA